MIMTTNGRRLISEISCNESDCKRRSECLIIHPVEEKGRVGTFYPKLEILFFGKFEVSCDHYKKE